MNTNPALSKEQREWLSGTPIFPEQFELTKHSGAKEYFRILDRESNGVLLGVDSRMGMKGFVLRVQDIDSEVVYAAKICVPEDYKSERTEKTEVALSAALRDGGTLFALPMHAGHIDKFPEMPGTQEKYVCFISEWVAGQTLEAWCISEGKSLSIEFIIQVVSDIARAVTFLGRKDLKHDDLHWGNVMVRPKTPELIMSESDQYEVSICLIDMGSLKPKTQQTNKSKDDYLSMVHILHQIYNEAWRQRNIAVAAPKFFDKFFQLLDSMLDEDPSRYYPDPAMLMRAIDNLNQDIDDDTLSGGAAKIFDPFEGISAEHLADDETLLSIFSEALPWFRFMMEPKPLVLTGPRGCGKSMLFRFMSASTQIKAAKKGVVTTPISGFGVYISCATHLQNNLIWIARDPGRVRKYAHKVTTYFQLVVARELVKALGLVWADNEARKQFDLRFPMLERWLSWITNQFDNTIETPRLVGENRLLHFSEDLDRACIAVYKDMLNGRSEGIVLPDGFLGAITEKLVELLPRFKRDPVVFLLDDYTENRLHADIQSVLNRIIFERRASHYFKISCERLGFNAIDSEGVRIDDSREYEGMDAGRHAVEDCKISEAVAFLGGLIDKRLAKAGWSGSTATLLGSSSPYENDSDLATFIRDEGSKQGKKYYYYGMTHLAQLWSGDIATILQVFKEMCIHGNVDKSTTQVIPKHVQHRSITAVSKAYRARVKDMHPHGLPLSRVLESYGEMARRVLVGGRLKSGDAPRRLYRIEMTMQSSDPLLIQLGNLNSDASQVATELMKRSIFQPLRESRGKEGAETITVRWVMRNIYRPSFGLSLRDGESYLDIKKIEDFVDFLVEPASYCDRRALNYERGRGFDRHTPDLFNGDEFDE